MSNVDLSYDYLESNLLRILDKMAPVKTVQHRTNFKSWITQDTNDTDTLVGRLLEGPNWPQTGPPIGNIGTNVPV